MISKIKDKVTKEVVEGVVNTGVETVKDGAHSFVNVVLLKIAITAISIITIVGALLTTAYTFLRAI